MTISRNTIILAVLGILVLAAAAYVTFGGTSGSAVVSTAPASEAELKFLGLTSRIDPVELDTSILEDARFKALRDIRIGINPETKGRADPFGPL